jgi:taurine--2-oxoglutarate transaminase
MLFAGLTYCGHPLACAAGLAALAAYEEEGLIERSRRMGAQLFAELKRLEARHPVIGDVRGCRGLFAVIELVANRVSRAPLAPWPRQPAALKALVEAAFAEENMSIATRGNLIILAPPLVISERELADAVGALDRLLARFFPSQTSLSA